MAKLRWIQLGIFLALEFILGAQLVGILRTIKLEQIPMKQVFEQPLDLLSWEHYLSFFNYADFLNITLYVLIGWTAITGMKHAVSGNFKTRGNYQAVPEFGSAGTAKWMEKKEIKQMFYTSQEGVPLGSIEPGKEIDEEGNRFVPYKKDGVYATLSPRLGKNENIFVFGPSGSSKTVAFVLPLIDRAMRLGESIVCTDLKGELHEFTRKDLEAEGYTVYVLDFIKRKRGNHYNAIMCLNADDEDEILKTANAFVQGSKVAKGKQGGGSSDPMWENAETSLLAALMGYVLQLYPKEEHTFETIVKILHSLKDSEIAEDIFAVNGVTGAPLSWYNDFLLTADSEKMRAGIIGGLAINLSKLASQGIRAMISKNDFDFKEFATKKTAMFIMIPPNDKTFASFITVFWQQFFDQIYNFAFENGNKLPVKIRAILEEKANIGRIQTLPEVISTSRGLGLKVNIVYQDANQPKEQYGDTWETLASNCDTWLVLGCNDNTTAKYLSEKIASTTVKVQNKSLSKDGTQMINTKSASLNYNYQQRALVDVGEMQRMPADMVYVLPRGKDPVKLYKIQYQHWKYRFCEPTPYDQLPLLSQPNTNSRVEQNTEVTHQDRNDEDQFLGEASPEQQEPAAVVEETMDSSKDELDLMDEKENETLTLDELLGKKA